MMITKQRLQIKSMRNPHLEKKAPNIYSRHCTICTCCCLVSHINHHHAMMHITCTTNLFILITTFPAYKTTSINMDSFMKRISSTTFKKWEKSHTHKQTNKQIAPCNLQQCLWLLCDANVMQV